jgi:transcriptional regulator with XRE-family HTH domain
MSKNSERRLSVEDRKRLAEQVRTTRDALGMTQSDLAQAAGVTRQTVSNLENGTAPQERVLRSVLAVLGISATGSTYSEDTEMWLGIIGGVLEALPDDSRNRAGQAAVTVVTQELARARTEAVDVGEVTEDDWEFEANPPAKGDLRLAAKRGTRK